MPNTKPRSTLKRIPPIPFDQRNQAEFQRTIRLTEQAIAKLEAKGHPVTLMTVAETTREFDDRGKGISSITILRNPEAAALFRQHSPAYQARQHTAQRAKRKHSKVKINADTRAMYRGLRASDLIQMVEDLKAQIIALQTQRAQLQAERNEAYRLHDEAMQQNARQLAALTKLTER